MLRLPTPFKHPDKETTRDLMVAYTARSCSPAEKVDFESHFLSCDECLATLAIILRLLHFPVCEEEETTLALLYPIGMEAARVALRAGMKVSTSDGKIPLLESTFPGGRMTPSWPGGRCDSHSQSEYRAVIVVSAALARHGLIDGRNDDSGLFA
jgi:putative zinc finger protein